MPQQITNDVIATDAITAASIAANAVGSAEIAANAVTTAKIADANVTTAKIADANVTPAKLSQPLTAGTVQATTSLSFRDFAVPSWARRIRVCLAGVSLSGTDMIQIQVSTPTLGFINTGYLSAGMVNGAAANSTTGFYVYLNAGASAADTYHGVLELTLVDPTNYVYVAHGCFATSNVARVHNTAGRTPTTITEPINSVRITVTGSNTFDAGSANVIYD